MDAWEEKLTTSFQRVDSFFQSKLPMMNEKLIGYDSYMHSTNVRQKSSSVGGFCSILAFVALCLMTSIDVFKVAAVEDPDISTEVRGPMAQKATIEGLAIEITGDYEWDERFFSFDFVRRHYVSGQTKAECEEKLGIDLDGSGTLDEGEFASLNWAGVCKMPKHYLGIVACRPSAHMPKNATMLCPATLDGSVDIGGQYNDALVSDERRDFWFAEVAFKLCAFGEKTDGGQPCANATEREEYLSGLPTVNIWTKTRRALGAKSDWGSEYYQQLDFSTWNEINSYYAITKETKGTRSGLGVEVMPLWPRYEGYETKSSTNTNLFDGEEFLEIFFRESVYRSYKTHSSYFTWLDLLTNFGANASLVAIVFGTFMGASLFNRLLSQAEVKAQMDKLATHIQLKDCGKHNEDKLFDFLSEALKESFDQKASESSLAEAEERLSLMLQKKSAEAEEELSLVRAAAPVEESAPRNIFGMSV